MGIFGHKDKKVYVATMFQRLVRIDKALKSNRLTAAELKTIAALSTTDLADENLPEQVLARKLRDILAPEDNATVAINKQVGLEETLHQFEMEHEDYLPLQPLTGGNRDTLLQYVNDFALFYDVFIQHVHIIEHQTDLGSVTNFQVDEFALHAALTHWKSTRPLQLKFSTNKPNQLFEPAGLFEKFLNGSLKKNEWLSDLDIERGLKLFGLTAEKVGAHAVRLTPKDIGLAIHLERIKHERDNPARAYTIPLIVNLGENAHARIDSHGMHWTRLLITVNPLQVPPDITVNYVDSLSLSATSKKTIRETILKSLQYYEEVGNHALPGGVQIFKAFPECEAPRINVRDTGEQRDEFTCGYRALQGIISDLITAGTIHRNESYDTFLACDTPASLRNFVYKNLIGEQAIPLKEHEKIKGQMEAVFKKKDAEDYFQIDSTLIEGQLHAFDTPELKRPKQKMLNKAELEKLATDKKMQEELSRIPVIAAIQKVKGLNSQFDINIKAFLADIQASVAGGAFRCGTPDLSQQLKAIFQAISENPNISCINISGLEGLDSEIIRTLEVTLGNLTLNTSIISSCPELASYKEILKERNSLILRYFPTATLVKDPWDTLFQAMLSDTNPSSVHKATSELVFYAKLKMTGLSKFFQYIANHEEVFPNSSFPFQRFSLVLKEEDEDGLSFLKTLTTHLQSNSPNLTYLPFNEFVCKMKSLEPMNGKDLVAILQVLLPLLTAHKIERLDLHISTFDGLELDDILALNECVKTQNISTIFTIQGLPQCSPANKPLQEALSQLGTSIAINRRKLAVPPVLENPPQNAGLVAEKPVKVLGKIGRAIFNQEGEVHYASEVQIQEQVQVMSQVQQQIQNIDFDGQPDEDELAEEHLMTFAGDEKLLDKKAFIEDPEIIDFMMRTNIKLTYAECWDMLVGKNSEQFAYGIHKMTMSTAKKCLAHLEDFQFQIHPDNPPHGFRLAKDPNGFPGLVLIYDPLHPPLNPNKSPLTPSLRQPKAANAWTGNALQFLTEIQAKKLHEKIKSLLSKMENSALSLDDHIANFFFIKSSKDANKSNKIKLIVLYAFIEGMDAQHSQETIEYIKKIFGKIPNNRNIFALSEILYERGVGSLLSLLKNLDELKNIRGEEFFNSFKATFVDQSLNLNELLTDDAIAAMQTIKEFTPAKAAWWQSLTVQHSQNLAFSGAPQDNNEDFESLPVTRHSNLAELCQGFTYFNNELEKIKPGLVLSDTCPLTGVADMRVGLDRLLTILRNAHNVDEQFYESLKDLSLEGLSAFYASRYEGYKLVTEEMNLTFGSLGKKSQVELKRSEKGMVFRVSKFGVRSAIYSDINLPINEQNKELNTYFLRYIATFNQRAPLCVYKKIFDTICSNDFLIKFPDKDYVGYRENLLVMIATFGTGKRGKNFSEEDIKKIKQLLDKLSTPSQKVDGAILFSRWSDISRFPIKPTISELIDISELFLENEPNSSYGIKAKTVAIKVLAEAYNTHADFLFEALANATKNKSHLPLDVIFNALENIEDTPGNRWDDFLARNIQKYLREMECNKIQLKDNEFSTFISKLLEENFNTPNNDTILHAMIKDIIEKEAAADDKNETKKLKEVELLIKQYARKGRQSNPKYNGKNDMGLFLRANLVKVLANCKHDNAANQPYIANELINKINQLYQNINSCHKKHGQTTSYALVELLTNIDIEKSKDSLPTLDALITLTREIADEDNAYPFNALMDKVKTHLPEACVLSFNKTVVEPSAPVANLHTILAKNMVEIREQLKEYIRYGNEVQKFVDSLYTSRGPEILLENLKLLANLNLSFGFDQTIKNKVMGAMLNVYNSVIDKGLQRIKVPKNIQLILKKFIEEQLSHPIRNEKDFSVFTVIFASQLTQLEQLLINLQKINETWPNDFQSLPDALRNAKSIGDYSVQALIHITSIFLENYNQSKPFPIETFRLFFPSDKPLSPNDVLAIIDFIFGADLQEKYHFSDSEREKLCQMAVAFNDPNDRELYLKKIIKLKETDPDLFGIKLDLLGRDVKPFEALERLENTITYLDGVKEESHEIVHEVFSFYHKHPNDFKDFMDACSEIADKKQLANCLTIAILAAKKAEQNQVNQNQVNYDKTAIEAAVRNLKVNPNTTERLAAIYKGSIYPDIMRLQTELASVQGDSGLNFDKLERDFDRDPYGFRSAVDTGEDTIQAQFDTILSTSVKVISSTPDKNEQEAVIKMKNIFFIVQAGKVQIGFCSKEGKYVQAKVESAEVKTLLAKYQNNSIIKNQTDLLKIKAYSESLNARIPFSLTEIIDGMRSLNYDRPLLLSERTEPQHWFLYINAIGLGHDDEGNSCTLPTVAGVEKAVKDMSSAEIRALQTQYRENIKNFNLSKHEKIKIQLDYVALIREVMYRTTGQFPRSTQILYLLKAIQSGDDLVAQIKTGEGKSKTAALAAALLSLQGFDADLVTINLALAAEGLKDNKAFFDYLGLQASMDYDAPGIHYGSLSTLDLHYSKMALAGKDFPENRACIIDELDALSQDDSTQNRVAVALDPITDPYQSPFEWAMDTLIQFVDEQRDVRTDEEFLELAKVRLKKEANSLPKKALLENLEKNPKEYETRLTTWILAAARTKELIKKEEFKFRIEKLNHEKLNEISKACILVNGRPNVEAEFSHTIQQMLHLRLRENPKYKAKIAEGAMPKFLVEPEKVYISSSNSNLFLDRYRRRLAMTATPGSKKEIEEQYQKYHFNFVSLPPFAPSQRMDLLPVLTSGKNLRNPEKEDEEHIRNIVNDILRVLATEKKGQLARPILVHAKTKIQGEKIKEVLEQALAKHPSSYAGKYNHIQSFYSNTDTNVESACKTEAGKNGVITISTVFERGTDIIPTDHPKGLYDILTSVDTLGISDEDLERSTEQKKGRTARQAQYGETRLIIKRSEFKDCYTHKEMKQMPATQEGVHQAIQALNQLRNQARTAERNQRESFEKLKSLVSKQFSNYSKFIQQSQNATFKKHLREQIKMKRAVFLQAVDEKWQQLQSSPENKDKSPMQLLDPISQFASDSWKIVDLEIRNDANRLAQQLQISISLPTDTELDVKALHDAIQKRGAPTRRNYVKKAELLGELNPSTTATEAYCDMRAGDDTANTSTNISSNKSTKSLEELRKNVALKQLKETVEKLSTAAYRAKLGCKFSLIENDPKLIENTVGALLYLRYKAYRDDNPLGTACLGREYRKLITQLCKTKNPAYLEQIAQAEEKHFMALHAHQGKHEDKKGIYSSKLMTESRNLLPLGERSWKDKIFNDWWHGVGKAKTTSFRCKVIDLLSSYQNNWWGRTWVSTDRKVLANQLITKLKGSDAMSIIAIIVEIHATRKSLLEEDKRQGRSIQAGLNGRLNSHLNEIKKQAILASSPQTLDSLVGYEFEDIKNVLEIFKTKIHGQGQKFIIATIEALDISKINLLPMNNMENRELPILEISNQYQALTLLFNEIEAQSANPTQAKDASFQALSQFCHKKQNELEGYFSQCGRLKDLLNPSHATNIALSKGATNIVQEVLVKKLYGNDIIKSNTKEMSYLDDTITIATPDAIQAEYSNNSFFKTINHIATYKALLYNTEKAIVENSKGNPNIRFTSLRLSIVQEELGDLKVPARSGYFKLTIAFEIDGVGREIDYNFNMKTKTVHVALFPEEPKLEPLPLSRKVTIERSLEGLQEQATQALAELANVENDQCTVPTMSLVK